MTRWLPSVLAVAVLAAALCRKPRTPAPPLVPRGPLTIDEVLARWPKVGQD